MMMITFYLVGILGAAAVWWLISMSQRYRISWLYIAGLAIGICMILFCIAWSVGSVLEGVPRAAAMGVVFFGFPGMVLVTLLARYATRSTKQG